MAYIIDTTGGRLPEEASSWMETFRACTDQCLMLRWRQVSWTFQHFNFLVILRLPGARIPDDRLLATDSGHCDAGDIVHVSVVHGFSIMNSPAFSSLVQGVAR